MNRLRFKVMKNRPAKFHMLYRTLLAIIWLIFLLLALEAIWRSFSFAALVLAGNQYHSTVMLARQEDDNAFQIASEHSAPPDSLLWQVPARGAIVTLDDFNRKQLAQQRMELLLVCDAHGTIQEIYPYTGAEELKILGDLSHIGGNVGDILPPDEGMDAMRAVEITIETGISQTRHYNLTLSHTETTAIEMDCYPISESPGRCAVFFSYSEYLDIFKRYRPDVYRVNRYKGTYINSLFWTNRLGFRDREIIIPKPPDVYRIVCIGGSTTVEGPHNDLTYPKFLEKMLRMHFGTDLIEVFNCGTDAVTLSIEYERFPEFLALEPDMIIHYNFINDLADIITSAGDAHGMRTGLMGRLRYCAARSFVLRKLRGKWFVPSISQVENQLHHCALSYIEKMNEICRQRGITFVACSFAFPDINNLPLLEKRLFAQISSNNYITVLPKRYQKDIVEKYNSILFLLCENQKIPYMPVAENLVGGIDLFVDDCHLRVKGIEQKATIIFENIRPFIEAQLAVN